MSLLLKRACGVAIALGLAAACGNAGFTPDDSGDTGIGGSGGDSSQGGSSDVGGTTGGSSPSAGGVSGSAGSTGTGGASPATGGAPAGTGGGGHAGSGASAGASGGAPAGQGGSPGIGGNTFGAGGAATGAGGNGPVVPTTCAEANDMIGCCSPDGSTAYFCDKTGKFTAKTCSSGDCGWVSASSYYNCGGKGSDPSGGAPLVCGGGSTGGNVIPTTCSQAHGDPGCCGPDGNEYYCKTGSTTVTKLDCSSSGQCGWGTTHYGCGKTGADPSGKNPITCGP